MQGRVIPPSVLKFRSAGARVLKDTEALYQGCRESPGPATNLAKGNNLNAVQGFMTTKWRVIDGVGQEPCKSGVRRGQVAQPDEVRLVRLCTAGDRQKAAVSSAGGQAAA